MMAVILAMDALLRHSPKHTPSMVFDDLFAALDSAAGDRLAEYLGELANQIFITAREIRAGSIV